jgi:A/G-specific adenine glycosylase
MLAHHLHSRNGGRFPHSISALMQLPGVGRYTAHAVAAFAFGQQIPVVDVNVRRVLSRICFTMKTTATVADESTLWRIAADLLPKGKAYEWNQALMDLGATVCTGLRPRCGECPVAAVCASRAVMIPARVRPFAQRERSHRGTPLRLYRGRVIEALRNAHPQRNVSASRLGRSILPRFTKSDRQVFHRLLCGLERDGLVQVRRNRQSVPQRVSLA